MNSTLHEVPAEETNALWVIHLRNCCRVILETDPATIAGRVAMRGADSELPLTEQVTLLACREKSFLYVCTVSSLTSDCHHVRDC